MNDPLDLLRCPVTKSRLRWRDATTLIADVGGHTYPVVHGLMDFRLFDPPYRSREEEASLVELLVQAAETMDYAELVRYYGTGLCSDLPAARIPSHISHWLALRQRAPKRLQDLFAVAGVVRIPEGSVVLDLGCGSGEAIGMLQEQGASQVIGIDISLIELAFARKLLAETGREALLVAGCAEALPFSNEVFGFI